MPRFWFIYSFILLVVAAGAAPNWADHDESLPAFTENLEAEINRYRDWYEIPGVAIALIDDGQLVWTAAYGYADREQGREMTVNAICRAESISKSVTAWGVMKLVNQGLIDLDAPVQQYLGNWQLPASEFPSEEVTIRRLLSNSAGLQLGTLGAEFPPQAEMPALREYLSKEVSITYKPGSQFLYSNAGFNLLELVVEEVTGRDFADYMAREVLAPLGMQRSSYRWNEQWADSIPMGYDLQGQPVPPYVYPASGSGGLFASIEDIARFVMAGMAVGQHSASVVLSRQSISRIQAPQVTTSGLFGFVANTYGFGHFIETLPDGRRAVWHGGQGHGWMTHFHSVPETGDGIVIFTNSQRAWPMMAQLIDDWATWSGIGSVKFSFITAIVFILWIITGLILLLVVWHTATIISGIRTGRRKQAVSLRRPTFGRVVSLLLFLAIAALLGWAVTQDYLFIFSIFPVGATWLGWALAMLAATLLLSVLFPVDRKNTHSQPQTG